MKPRGLTLLNVLACLVLASAWALTAEPWSRTRTSPWAFEIKLATDQSGIAQVYYDSGLGFNEQDSVIRPTASGSDAVLRFPLPYGHISSLRFDPTDRDAHLVLSGARLVDGSGRSVRQFGPGAFVAPFQIRAAVPSGDELHVDTLPDATDAHLTVDLGGAVDIPRPPFWRDAAPAFLCALAALLLFERWRPRLGPLWAGAAARPVAATALAALLATLAANFPVVFQGRTIVSPNMGVALLYGQTPWLPGIQSGEEGDSHKADVAALMWHHLPLSALEGRAIAQGELPLWNRYDSTGLPLLGQGQSCFGDPLNLIPIAAKGASWAWDLKFLIAKWLFALGVGLCALRLFRHLPTALLIGASAPFMGFFVYRINHPAVLSFCYSPWILYAWCACTEAKGARRSVRAFAGLIGANWMEMVSGTAKEAYVLLFALNFAGLTVLLFSSRSLREKAAKGAGSLVSGAVFAALSAPVWFTFFRALKASYTSYNQPEAFQIQPGMAVGLFDEAFYRPFQLESGVINPAANFFILVGLLWALVRWRDLLADRAGAALAAASLLLAALVFGVVPPAVINRIPFLGNVLHIDNSFSCALIVTLSVLAAFGWREAWNRLPGEAGRREAAMVGVLMALLFAAYFGTAQAVVRSEYASDTWGRLIHLSHFIYGYAVSLAVGAAVFLMALRCIRMRASSLAAGLALAAAGFLSFHWREALSVRGGFADYMVRPPARTDLMAPSPAIEAIKALPGQPFRVVGFHNDLLPGWSIVYSLEGISGPDALMNPYYRQLMDAAGVNRVWDWRYIIEPRDVAKLRPILDLLGVREYVGYHLGADRPGPELTRKESLDMDIYESPGAWPRAFYSDSAAVYGDVAQYSSWIKSGDGRPFVAISHDDWAALATVPRVSGDLKNRHVNPATNYRLTENTTAFTVTADGPGFIVLTEAYENGNFRAYIDGKRVPYLRANHAFKAVYVDNPGTYEVRFEYWPRGLWQSLYFSAAAAAVIAAALVWAARGDPKKV